MTFNEDFTVKDFKIDISQSPIVFDNYLHKKFTLSFDKNMTLYKCVQIILEKLSLDDLEPSWYVKEIDSKVHEILLHFKYDYIEDFAEEFIKLCKVSVFTDDENLNTEHSLYDRLRWCVDNVHHLSRPKDVFALNLIKAHEQLTEYQKNLI